MQGIPVASSPPGRVSLRGLVFWLPLAGYSLLAIVIAFYPRSPAVLAFLGTPLVLLAFAVNRGALKRRLRQFVGREEGAHSGMLKAATMRRSYLEALSSLTRWCPSLGMDDRKTRASP
jgi:hypothetical protein